MRRSSLNVLAASPVMVGAVTVLIVIVAVFLAYNANSGLPFVPTYRISAEVPDANTLVPGNDVRIGGVRVGMVEAVDPVQQEDGTDIARLDLKLDQSVDPLPKDTTVIVRSRSALGLKYLELVRGKSPSGLQEGSTIPVSHATPEPVELDQVLNTFDEPTRRAIQTNLTEFGTALGGRGPQLNEGVGALPPLLRDLRPVMRNLAAPGTGLARFISGAADTAAELAPVAEQQARLFVSLDSTFGALAGVARPYIQRTISESPRTLDVTTRSLPVIRPFLRHSQSLFALLRPGVAVLPETAPRLASALETGAPVLRDSPALNEQLAPTARSLQAFGEDPGVIAGLDRSIQTFDVLSPTLRFIAPAQTVCNYATLLLRNGASLLSLGDGVGTWQRFIVFAPPTGPNNEGSPASAPANGGGDANNFLHANPYPNTAAPGQTRECEAGNEQFLPGQQVIGNVPGNQGTATEGQP
jgi:virulence factor Mce-like protein